MLVLSRKSQERIHIGNDITVTIIRVKGNTVRVGIEAPNDVRILRAELPKIDEIDEVGPATDSGEQSDAKVSGEPTAADNPTRRSHRLSEPTPPSAGRRDDSFSGPGLQQILAARRSAWEMTSTGATR